MYAKLHERQQQQQPGSRAHVMEQQQQQQQEQPDSRADVVERQPDSEGAVGSEHAKPQIGEEAGTEVDPACGAD
jgi:hypothetical protein